MKLQLVLIFGLLGAGTAQAQMNNNQYHRNQQQIQNRNHMAEQHRQGYMNSQQQMQQQPPQPTGYWETTWGAIAPSPVGGVMGVAVGASSKEEAENIALTECKAKGGGACKVSAYHNQCIAMVLGEKEYTVWTAATAAEATDLSMADCKKENSSCNVYYSACTEPVFHRN